MAPPEGLILGPQDLGIGRLFESVRDAVIVAEANTGRIVLWNRAATKIFGYSLSEALQLRVEVLVPEHLKDQHRAGMSRYRETGQGRYVDSHEVLDLPAVRKTGEEIRVEFTLSPIGLADGTAAEGRFVLAIVRDVTKRKRAEEEIRRLTENLERLVAERTGELEAALARLKERERGLRETHEVRARLAAIVESSDDAIIGKTLDGTITSWNKGAQQIYGYSSEEVVGKPIDILVPPDRPGEIPKILERIRQGKAVDHYETVRVTKDGRCLDISLTVSPIKDSAGNIVGASTIARDITERKRTEERTREVREAERQRIARDLHDGVLQELTYAAAEAHLVKMLSAENTELDHRLEQVAGALKRASQGLREAVYDLRLTEERDRPFPESLESLLELSRRMNPGCDIRLELEDGFPSVSFESTGVELLRIIQEALNNARRHSRARSVRVALRLEGDEIQAEVSDDGRGFEPWVSRRGLGMSSMRQRAEALGGELEVKSEPGKGTRVRACVPLAPRVQEEE